MQTDGGALTLQIFLNNLQVLSASVDERTSLRSSNGTLYPYLVYERGLPAPEWQLRDRTGNEVLAFVEALADLLAQVHAQGLVHGHVEPGNVHLMHSKGWRLLDVGCAVPCGVLRCCLCPGIRQFHGLSVYVRFACVLPCQCVPT